MVPDAEDVSPPACLLVVSSNSTLVESPRVQGRAARFGTRLSQSHRAALELKTDSPDTDAKYGADTTTEKQCDKTRQTDRDAYTDRKVPFPPFGTTTPREHQVKDREAHRNAEHTNINVETGQSKQQTTNLNRRMSSSSKTFCSAHGVLFVRNCYSRKLLCLASFFYFAHCDGLRVGMCSNSSIMQAPSESHNRTTNMFTTTTTPRASPLITALAVFSVGEWAMARRKNPREALQTSIGYVGAHACVRDMTMHAQFSVPSLKACTREDTFIGTPHWRFSSLTVHHQYAFILTKKRRVLRRGYRPLHPPQTLLDQRFQAPSFLGSFGKAGAQPPAKLAQDALFQQT